MDKEYRDKSAEALSRSSTLRYVASVTPSKIEVGLRSVPLNSPLGSLSGTDNLIALTTARYASAPLVVKGAGAGSDVTAAGIVSDIISVARQG